MNPRQHNDNIEDPCFHPMMMNVGIGESLVSRKLNNPFYHTPPELAIIAANKLKKSIPNYPWKHEFGTAGQFNEFALGKMFGVLVVSNKQGDIGYLRAFSGKIDESNNWEGFVPPVFNVLETDGFFKVGERELNELTLKVEAAEANPIYQNKLEERNTFEHQFNLELGELKYHNAEKKARRDLIRKNNSDRSIIIELENESKRDHFVLKDFRKKGLARLESLNSELQILVQPIYDLKEKRKVLSNRIQKRIFDSYVFRNALGESKSLLDTFDITPPAGAGECCAPRLFQYAYLHGYNPIAIAEFWWGQSPPKEVRNHGEFYPACRSKCYPILTFMLQGLDVEANPIESEANTSSPKIIYEDDALMIIDKPNNYLSVPGKTKATSVLQWVKENHIVNDNPVIVHRLDMATSGIMVLAKTMESYHHLQKQFLNRSVNKRYTAILDGILDRNEGYIELPLRVDLDDRPRQLVCFEHGKPAKTRYQIVNIEGDKTRIHFYPITGRTHQLRVHASHLLGLGMPIVGDELYGIAGERLKLHADTLSFKHPETGERLTFTSPPEF